MVEDTALEKFEKFRRARAGEEIIEKPGVIPTQPTPKRKFKVPTLQKLLRAKKKKKISPKKRAVGISRLMRSLQPPTLPVRKRLVSPRQKALERFVRLKQSRLNTNLPEVLRQFNEDKRTQIFKQNLREREISFNTKMMLERLLHTQNLGKLANLRKQRQNRESRIMGQAQNLMRAHYNLSKVRIDFTGTENSILDTRNNNIMQSDPKFNILRPRPHHILEVTQDNILNTKHRLNF